MTDIAVVRVTDENRDALVEVALAMYTGEACRFCGFVYETVADLRARNVVYAGYHSRGRTACKTCWDAYADAPEPPAAAGDGAP